VKKFVQKCLERLMLPIRLLEEILHELRSIRRELAPKHFTQSIAIVFSGDFIMNTLTLNVGQSSIGTITPLAADGVTPSGGTVSAASFSLPVDPSITAVDNSDGTITITGIAVSVATVSGIASCTISDPDGAVSTFSQSFTVTVVGVTPPPPSATTASIGISFTTPA